MHIVKTPVDFGRLLLDAKILVCIRLHSTCQHCASSTQSTAYPTDSLHQTVCYNVQHVLLYRPNRAKAFTGTPSDY